MVQKFIASELIVSKIGVQKLKASKIGGIKSLVVLKHMVQPRSRYPCIWQSEVIRVVSAATETSLKNIIAKHFCFSGRINRVVWIRKTTIVAILVLRIPTLSTQGITTYFNDIPIRNS